MKKLIDKAAILIEALPYIQKYKGKKIVIKYGGSVISEEININSVLRDIVFMNTVGMQPILVHGGGKTITARLKEANIPAQFIDGLRYTDEKTIQVVKEVLRDEISHHIADILKNFGADPILLNGLDGGIIRCKKLNQHMGKNVDLGFVGDIVSVRRDIILKACEEGKIPVVAPIGVDDQGQLYNINADLMAGELSAAISAEKMVYLSDIPGILRDINNPESLMSSLKKSQIDELIAQAVISGGMIPKIQSCIKSMDAGAKKTHIIDGRLQHSLLLEIFTDRGVGTEIVQG